MFHAEAEDGCGVVVADLLLFRVEAHSLPNDGGLWTGSAPYREGHFEADGEDPLAGLAGSTAEGIPAASQSIIDIVGVVKD